MTVSTSPSGSRLGASVAVALLLVGCGDSSTAAGGGPSGGAGPVGGFGGGAAAGLVINEIQPHDAEWLEIANGSDSEIDISGFGVCDEDASGACEIASAMRFPAGTTIPPGGYIVILTDQADGDPGPYDVCMPGVTSCFYASWKISAGDGELIQVIDADDAVVAALLYPSGATPDATFTLSRLPDITGPAAIGAPTPGAPNTP